MEDVRYLKNFKYISWNFEKNFLHKKDLVCLEVTFRGKNKYFTITPKILSLFLASSKQTVIIENANMMFLSKEATEKD